MIDTDLIARLNIAITNRRTNVPDVGQRVVNELASITDLLFALLKEVQQRKP